MDDLVAAFEMLLMRQGKASATINTYKWAIKDLLTFLFDHGVVRPDQLTMQQRHLLEAWQDRQVEHQLKPRTRALLAVGARQFLRFLARRGLVDNRLQWSLERPKVSRGIPRPVPEEDLRRLVTYLLPHRPMMGVLELRDRAMFFFFLASSARVSEGLQVRRDQIGRMIVQQKGGDEKALKVPPIVQVLVEEYLAARDDDCAWLWATHENNLEPRRLAVAGVREAWARIAWKVGVPRFTSRQLRHTGASVLFDLGLDSLEVARHLGHRGLAHVDNYVALLSGRRDHATEVMQAFLASGWGPGQRAMPSSAPPRDQRLA